MKTPESASAKIRRYLLPALVMFGLIGMTGSVGRASADSAPSPDTDPACQPGVTTKIVGEHNGGTAFYRIPTIDYVVYPDGPTCIQLLYDSYNPRTNVTSDMEIRGLGVEVEKPQILESLTKELGAPSRSRTIVTRISP